MTIESNLSTAIIRYEIIMKKEIQNISVFLEILIQIEKSHVPCKTSTSLSISSIVSNLQKLSKTKNRMNGNLKNYVFYNF